jgi:thioredoxin 2
LTNIKNKSDIYAIYIKYYISLSRKIKTRTLIMNSMKITLITASFLTIVWLSSCGGNAEHKDSTQAGMVATSSTTESPAAETSASGMPIHLTKSEFLTKVYDYEKNPNEWVYIGDKPCIVDFYADWCRPCKMIAPILEDLAKKYDGQIVVYKINTDQERELASFFGIQSIPTLLFCPMNGKPQMSQGALPKETFEKVVSDVLLAKK